MELEFKMTLLLEHESPPITTWQWHDSMRINCDGRFKLDMSIKKQSES